MPETVVEDQVAAAPSSTEEVTQAPLEMTDLLVEDVSIDGMCGVY